MLKRKTILSCFLAFGFLLLVTANGYSLSISFEPLVTNIMVGDSFSVDMVVSGLENDNLSTFDVDVLFDDSILTFDSYALGSGLGDVGLDTVDLSLGYLGGGVIDLAEFSLIPPDSSDGTFFADQADSFPLATLSFTGIGEGNDLISIDELDPFLLFADPDFIGTETL